MKKKFIASVIASILTAQMVSATDGMGPYEPTWESLSQHTPAPGWLKDAKFGIYFHWGVYSVPAFSSEWYPRWMYFDGHEVNQHHIATWGPPDAFGYHDFVPLFKAEHFDPVEWVELFKQSGARFAGPVAEHHDGFSMWDSEVTPWNAADKGPHRDIMGELYKALRANGMKTIATFHHARNLQRYKDSWKEEVRKMQEGEEQDSFRDSHYPYIPGLPTASESPELNYLYGNIPEEKWLDEVWLGKLKEVIDNYQPDMIWFDSWLDRIPEDYRQQFSAYYLNRAEDWNKEVAIIRKQDDLPLSYTINDHEKSREPRALLDLWMTDDTISTGSWCYTEDMEIKPARKIIHALIDTVAKNGVFLLNVSPKADGTIPEDQRSVLCELGDWLDTNGQAIYGTRPWTHSAEGPTVEPEDGFKNYKDFLDLEYSAADVRYTASEDGKTVYAILLGIPPAGEPIFLKSPLSYNGSLKRVRLLSGQLLSWRFSNKGLKIEVPEMSGSHACVFVLEYY